MLAEADTVFWSRVLSSIGEDLSEKVCDYIVGSRYSAVKLCSGYVGVSYSYVQEDRCTPKSIHRARVEDFIEGLSSDCIIERALSQAAINALGQKRISHTPEGIAYNGLEEEISSTLKKGSLVVFAGSVKKLPEYYRGKGFKVIVTDRNPYTRGVLPDYYLYKYLPRADAVYLTGAAFSRPDIDQVIYMASNAEYLVSVGPSLSVPPEYLEDTGLTHQATSIIMDPDKVFTLAKLGYGYHSMRDYIKHIYMTISSSR